MPVVALIGAAASVAAGVTAIGAATTIGATFMAGLQIAGGVIGGLGALTGNKKLMKIGAVAGIVGGIGSAFSGTLFGDGGASTAGSSLAAEGLGNGSTTFGNLRAIDPSGSALTGGPLSQSAIATTPTTSSVLDAATNIRAISGTSYSPSLTGGAKTGNGLVDMISNAPSKVEGFMTQHPTLTKTVGGAFKGLLDSYSQQDAIAQRTRDEQKLIEEKRRKLNESIMNQQPLMRTI